MESKWTRYPRSYPGGSLDNEIFVLIFNEERPFRNALWAGGELPTVSRPAATGSSQYSYWYISHVGIGQCCVHSAPTVGEGAHVSSLQMTNIGHMCYKICCV